MNLHDLVQLALGAYAWVAADPDRAAIASLAASLGLTVAAGALDALVRRSFSADKFKSWVETKFLESPMGKALAYAVGAWLLAVLSRDPSAKQATLHAVALVAATYSVPLWRDAKDWTVRLVVDIYMTAARQPLPPPPA